MNDDPYADNDLAELKKFLGSKVRVNCALQDCSLRDIAAMPQAELNICFGYGELLAQKMQENLACRISNALIPMVWQACRSFCVN